MWYVVIIFAYISCAIMYFCFLEKVSIADIYEVCSVFENKN